MGIPACETGAVSNKCLDRSITGSVHPEASGSSLTKYSVIRRTTGLSKRCAGDRLQVDDCRATD